MSTHLRGPVALFWGYLFQAFLDLGFETAWGDLKHMEARRQPKKAENDVKKIEETNYRREEEIRKKRKNETQSYITTPLPPHENSRSFGLSLSSHMCPADGVGS